uniref:Uncharacterized protein LOC8269550 isoform X2 n=1 Tax=Rhizophora mucronata TaxID=61149 RepID=A0A2P2JHA4_RHIMU
MRFKKGSKVEVLSKKDVPSGSWRGAEIICGNGDTYTVRYDGYLGRNGETAMEMVSRKAIRPYPPLTEVVENWIPGDVVEVFDDFSWKMATVTKVLDRKHFLVRLLGSSMEFKVGKFDIRPRQSWEDARWVVIGKGFGSCGYRKHDKSTLRNNHPQRFHVQRTCPKMHANVQVDCFPFRNMETFQESAVFSRQTLKRGAYGNPQVEAYGGTAKKFRAIEKEGELHRAIAVNHFSSPDQVDADKILHSSFDNRSRFPEMDTERRKLAVAVGCSSAIDVDSLDYNSVTSSVGSCSITGNNLSKLYGHTGFVEDIDVHRSDAESSSTWGDEEGNCIFPTKEELAAEIHRLELHAYHCTMGALYASGPLSWEQEALVTNLRFFLHISNDEHLMEVRNLVSADNTTGTR